MKTKIQKLSSQFLVSILSLLASTTILAQNTPGYNNKIPDNIMTPDQVETSIGTLKFFDGAPHPETAEKIYDYLDTMRGVDAFLKGMPGASLDALIQGNHELGAVQCYQVLIFDRLMDSNSLFLTGNTSTMYVLPTLDLERDGPTVLEAPPGMLGAFNDAWFRSVPRGRIKAKEASTWCCHPNTGVRCRRAISSCLPSLIGSGSS
jgi:hypothetical protein